MLFKFNVKSYSNLTIGPYIIQVWCQYNFENGFESYFSPGRYLFDYNKANSGTSWSIITI